MLKVLSDGRADLRPFIGGVRFDKNGVSRVLTVLFRLTAAVRFRNFMHLSTRTLAPYRKICLLFPTRLVYSFTERRSSASWERDGTKQHTRPGGGRNQGIQTFWASGIGDVVRVQCHQTRFVHRPYRDHSVRVGVDGFLEQVPCQPRVAERLITFSVVGRENIGKL